MTDVLLFFSCFHPRTLVQCFQGERRGKGGTDRSSDGGGAHGLRVRSDRGVGLATFWLRDNVPTN